MFQPTACNILLNGWRTNQSKCCIENNFVKIRIPAWLNHQVMLSSNRQTAQYRINNSVFDSNWISQSKLYFCYVLALKGARTYLHYTFTDKQHWSIVWTRDQIISNVKELPPPCLPGHHQVALFQDYNWTVQ